MVVSDPIADMLTRIRNANQLRYKEVAMPSSKDERRNCQNFKRRRIYC